MTLSLIKDCILKLLAVLIALTQRLGTARDFFRSFSFRGSYSYRFDYNVVFATKYLLVPTSPAAVTQALSNRKVITESSACASILVLIVGKGETGIDEFARIDEFAQVLNIYI